MVDFKKLDTARKLLGLDEEATLKEIKEAYRKAALKFHPDRCKGKKKKRCEELFKKINNAHETLIAYCAGYQYSFKRQDVKEDTLDKGSYEHFKRFYEDWLGKS